MWDLFKYFITYRGKNIMPETIQDTLWPDQDYEYSNKAFRTMIYRLRKALNKGSEDEAISGKGENQLIVFSHGCYGWNPDTDYFLDAEEFDRNLSAARQYRASDPQKAFACYQNIFDLYQGSYLAESMYTEWTIPVRNHYRRLFLESMADYCQLLADRADYRSVIQICEKVTLIEPLEEDFYLFMIEALLTEGKTKDARRLYEYITGKLYQELGVRPSSEMRSLYGRIAAAEKPAKADIETVQEEMTNTKAEEGPFFCDRKTFKSIYDLERRRVERSGQSVFMVLLTLEFADKAVLDKEAAERAFAALKDIIARSLRRGDVCALWEEFQFILILQGINIENTRMVVGRLETAFRERTKQNEIVLRARYQPVLANTFITVK
jgi:DNA-binding SARP family transcriptional activator